MPAGTGNPHAVEVRGLLAAPGRDIDLHLWRQGRGGLLRPDEARALSRALLEAADIAEHPDPDDGLYEDDEPVGGVESAFAAGEKGLTAQ